MNNQELQQRIDELTARLDEQSRLIQEQQQKIEQLERDIPRPPFSILFLNGLEEVLERQAKISGWTFTPTSIEGQKNDNGFGLTLDATVPSIGLGAGVTIKNTAIPFSGFGGLMIEHDTGEVNLEVSGNFGGSQQVLMQGNDSRYFGIFKNVTSGLDTWVETNIESIIFSNLPTTNPGGSGRLWNNGGVVNIT